MRVLGGLVTLLAVAAPLAASPVGEGAEVIATLTDGRTFVGPLVSETEEAVVLRIAGIATPIPRDRIDTLTPRPSVEQAYHARRAGLEDADVDGRLQLARDLFDRRAYELSRAELQSLREQAPHDGRIDVLLAAIEANRAPAAAAAGGGEAAARRTAPAGPPLLDEQQVNLMKVWELPQDLSEARLLMRVPRETMLRVFDEFRNDPQVPKGKVAQRDFFLRPDRQQVAFLFELAAANPGVRKYYREIRINGDPPVIDEFRRLLHGVYVQRYFHRFFGDGKVPGVHVIVRSNNPPAELYTNLYLLSTATVDGRPLINRRAPEESLLLQWGLPHEDAIHPAPAVGRWRPFFSGTDDPNFKRFVSWIESLYPNAGDYGIDFNGIGTGVQPHPPREPRAETSGDINP